MIVIKLLINWHVNRALFLLFFKSEPAECARSFALLRCSQVRVPCDSALGEVILGSLSLHKSNGNIANWLRKLSSRKLAFRMSLLV